MAESKPRLTYFAGRGLAEASRLALFAAKIEYEDVFLQTRDEFLQLIADGKLMFKQVPLLEIDGQCLIGSDCILRYVCNKGNLVGKTEEDRTKIDMLAMGAKDMLKSGFSHFKFVPPEQQEELLQGGVKQARERYLPVFEKCLAESKSGFLVGDSVSMADIMLFDVITYLNDLPKLKAELANFPNCRAFIDHLSNLPGIKEYLASPRRMPPPDDDYVKGVRHVLNP